MTKYLLIIIFVIGLALRLYKIDLPLLEFYPSRQIQTADITRNLYRDGFKILSPTVSYLGPQKQIFLVEFPLYNFFVASLYKISGSVNEYLGRLFSVLGWAVSFFLLYQLAKKYAGQTASLVAMFFYSFSPLSILTSRSFQPDQWMLTLSLASIYFMDIWKGKGKWYIFYLSALFASFSIFIKITSVLFTLIPVFYLYKDGHRKWLTVKTSIFLVMALLPSFLWYFYASAVSRSGEILTSDSEISNWFGLSVFLNTKYYANIFGFENNLVLLPVGIILFIVGFTIKTKNSQRLLSYWLVSIVLYFLIFNKHNMTHEYYHLPFLPIAAIFAGIGSEKIINNLSNLFLPKGILIFVLGILVFLTMFTMTLSKAYKPIGRFGHVIDAAFAIKRFSGEQDLVIGAMDAGPTLVYYSDRPGWLFEINRQDVASLYAFYGVKDQKVVPAEEELELLRDKGAKLFAAGNLEQFENNQSFSQYMFKNYNVLDKTGDYIIFDLNNK